MRKINFNNIENLTVPESWVEKALLLPEKVESKKVIHFSKHTRPLVAVASLFLVCALSVSLFFFTQKDDILKTDPDFSLETAIYESTVQSTQKTENFTGKSETEETENTESESTDAPTECETEGIYIENIETEDIYTEEIETEGKNEGDVDDTTDPNASSPNGVICNPNGSRPDGGELNSGGVSGGSKPNSKPISKPSVKPTVKPTEKPTEAPKKCEAYVDASLISSGDVVYGVFKAYSSQEYNTEQIYECVADVQFKEEKAYISFLPVEEGFVTNSGWYEYYFYINDEILHHGYIYIKV